MIPERSHHKDLAAKFIDYVLSDDVQNYLGNAGGIPVAGDASKINDEKSKAMIEEYASYANDGKLSYYPDYAASNLTDAVPAEFQELVNGTKKPADVLPGLHAPREGRRRGGRQGRQVQLIVYLISYPTSHGIIPVLLSINHE